MNINYSPIVENLMIKETDHFYRPIGLLSCNNQGHDHVLLGINIFKKKRFNKYIKSRTII